jgi:signal transduction histidine kinase
MQLDGNLTPPLARVRDVIDRQLAQLTRLVDDLLDVSRLTTGKIKLRMERVSLRDVIARSVETVRPLVDQRHHQLVVDVPADDALELDGDGTRLAQVVQNLLINAAKYTPESGRLAVAARRVDGQAEVRVSDNGRGIAPEELERIFDLFEQGHAGTESPTDSGLGVGLALARALVGMHGGTMGVRSDGAGRGAEFTFRIPMNRGGGALTQEMPRSARALSRAKALGS